MEQVTPIKCDCGKLIAKVHEDGKIYLWCKRCHKEVELKINPAILRSSINKEP